MSYLNARNKQTIHEISRHVWHIHAKELMTDHGKIFNRAKSLLKRALHLLPEHDPEFTDRETLKLRSECIAMRIPGVKEVLLREINKIGNTSVNTNILYFATSYSETSALLINAHSDRIATVTRLREIIEYVVPLHTANYIASVTKHQQDLTIASNALAAALNTFKDLNFNIKCPYIYQFCKGSAALQHQERCFKQEIVYNNLFNKAVSIQENYEIES